MKSKKTKTIRHVENFWIDLVPEIKFPILDKAVEYGYLKKEFIEKMKQLEINEGKKRQNN